ncbi:phosphotyrosine protein phosphatase I superfamily [Globomyces pollinis-pini]|nr:phosphotyrosine protein phosphatase I superfamily [Globomyces pollinis-pini]KAJ2999890.1 hypothetical protein HDV02_001409 [Globomyces sp. JEL0801]
MPSVLFLCTHNSARSQIAEAVLRHLDSTGTFESYSAGSEVTFVRPLAIEVMKEWNVDMSSHTSKTLDQFLNQKIDIVITVCDSANDTCPHFPSASKRLHWSFPDPSKAVGTPDEQLQVYRTVRDGLAERIKTELLAK